MSCITAKSGDLTFYLDRRLQDKVSEELTRLYEIHKTYESDAAQRYITRMSDFIVNDKNELIKCRYSVHDLIEAFEDRVQWLRKVNDE